jgi:hypothetical protein
LDQKRIRTTRDSRKALTVIGVARLVVVEGGAAFVGWCEAAACQKTRRRSFAPERNGAARGPKLA